MVHADPELENQRHGAGEGAAGGIDGWELAGMQVTACRFASLAWLKGSKSPRELAAGG